MPTPPTPDPRPPGSTGAYAAVPEPSPSLLHLFGSSFVHLLPANPDDAPTVISATRPATKPEVSGQKLGHFELLEAIGAGGMATVLKARDLELGRIVALKILPPETAKDAEVVSRFKQEGRAAAKLHHDNIAQVYFCGEDRGLHFIAFEFVEGENLRQVLERRGPLPATECVRYMLQVAAGLAHAAERGVVHRDIKPSNILITPDGRAKIVDMGLARHLESHSVNGGVTQSGVTLGTFDYISPEQAMDPRRADARSDIYSLGCAFYHALTGRPPVPEGTAAKKLYAHQHESPLDPRDINPAVPDAMAAVLAKMMAKDPDRRYPTPAALIADLSQLAREWNLAADGLPLADPASAPRAPAAMPKVPFGLLLGGSVVAVAIAILAGVSGTPPGGPSVPWADEKSLVRAAPLEVAPLPPTVPPKAEAAIADGKAFAAALREKRSVVRLVPGATIDVTESLTFSGADLTIEPDGGSANPPTLKLSAPLVVRDCGKLTLRGLRLLVGEAAGPEFVAVACENVGRVELDAVRVRGARAVGVSVSGPRAEVTVRHAIFDLGPQGVGLRLGGRVAADISQSAFGPHEAAVQLLADADAAESLPARVNFAECSFLLERGGAAVEAERGAAFAVSAEYCVFASDVVPPAATMPGTMPPEPRPCVLRLHGDGPTTFRGGGKPNAYYRTDALATPDGGFSFDEAARRYASSPVADPAAVLRDVSPWEDLEPRKRLAGDTPERAFRLSLTDAKLHVAGNVGIFGAKELRPDRTRIYPEATFPRAKPLPVAAGEKQRVVWPGADPADAARFVYDDFAAAFAALKPGETLLVAANGPVEVKSLPEVKGLKATVKPYPGFSPELVPDPGFRDPSLFRLTDGELTFDGLAIRLTDRKYVVGLSGGRACVFKGCTITLDDKDGDPAAVVAVLEVTREMRMGPADAASVPDVQFTNTLVRGKGRAVWVSVARSFSVAADNSAFALDGSFLAMDPPPRDAAAAEASVKLTHVTTLLSGPLLELRAAKDPMARVVPVNVSVDRCLFAPVAPARPGVFVSIDDAEPGAEPRRYLSWDARGASVYANAEKQTALELRPWDDSPATTWDIARWREFGRDAGTDGNVSFAGKNLRNRLNLVRLADLKAERTDTRTAVEAGLRFGDE